MRYLNWLFTVMVLVSCSSEKAEFDSFDEYPSALDADLWTTYTPQATTFKIWSPTAEKVRLHLYQNGHQGEAQATHNLVLEENGVWNKQISGDLLGKYYTYQVMVEGVWLEETPGIYAQAVGVNGRRAMVIDLDRTDPQGWDQDRGPSIQYPNEAIIYELHIRDMTIHPQSGSAFPGKYKGLVETGTKGPEGVTTGLDHLKELGITHVHLLPTYDHYSINETRLDSAQFNWGYDPQNYNVPEGSFASDPYRAEVRIREFKEMVKGFHDHGIGVILDVVYNHTGRTENSNFNLEAPGYYYRHWEDGSLSDAAACGNETASERDMMRKFILESVTYWAREYHLDGFRFDLMGIHDISTMNEVASKLETLNPHIFVYGEGWTAGDSPLPATERALKHHVAKMPLVTAFSDDIRDGIKGSVFDDLSTGFVNGADSMEESIKFGVVGAIQHPQIDYKSVNYSDAPWSSQPWQAISYVSCHDNHTLYDKLKVSRRDASETQLMAMHKLANAIVLTTQGTAFLHAGAEMLRSKHEEHNSYNLPDSINQIDWQDKAQHPEIVGYYQNLISLRKSHPAFRMISAQQVRDHLEFKEASDGLVSFQISDHANGDSWKNIRVVYNAKNEAVNYALPGIWKIAVLADEFDFVGNKAVVGKVAIPPVSMMIAFQE